MKQNEINRYLETNEGKQNAKRFILALEEKRLLCVVKNVSSSGMSRQIFFGEMHFEDHRPLGNSSAAVYQFNWFFGQLGFRYRQDSALVSVYGCGMDMIFHTLSNVCGILKEAGFVLPSDWSSLCCAYSSL